MFRGPFPLQKGHDTSQFDCGRDPLNAFIRRYALANQTNNSARTFVVLDGDRVVGYYSLAAGAVAYEEAPSRMAKGLARHPIPVVLMARFAVDLGAQGQGLGRALFKDALKRALAASREIAARAFVVHAKDDAAKAFYERVEMEAFPGNPYHLSLLMKDVARALDVDQG